MKFPEAVALLRSRVGEKVSPPLMAKVLAEVLKLRSEDPETFDAMCLDVEKGRAVRERFKASLKSVPRGEAPTPTPEAVGLPLGSGNALRRA